MRLWSKMGRAVVMLWTVMSMVEVSGEKQWTECSDWECEKSGQCCAVLRQPGLNGLEHPICLPCQDVPRKACHSLAAHPGLIAALPSLRLHLHFRGVTEQTQILTCPHFACNAPPHQDQPRAPAQTGTRLQICWHDSPLNPFFSNNLGAGTPVLVRCPEHRHCCTTALLPDGQRWALGCAVCPLPILTLTSLPRPTSLNDTAETSPWNPSTLLCSINSTDLNRTTDLVEPGQRSDGSKSREWEVCSPLRGCQNKAHCCLTIGGATVNNQLQLHFCIPCQLKSPAPPSLDLERENKAIPTCSPLGNWDQRSLPILRQFLPSVYNFLHSRNLTSKVDICHGSGCNHPRLSLKRSGEYEGSWCWHWSPLARFFKGNANGRSAVVGKCPRGQDCCSLYSDADTSWAIGCATCTHSHRAHSSWRQGEISPWQDSSEICALPQSSDSASLYATESKEAGESVCQAEGVEPHLSWKCPAETGCCLTAGHLDRPWLPRLPACLPCSILRDALELDVAPAEPLCAPLSHWHNRTNHTIQDQDHLPNLQAFFLNHEWVLKDANVTVCKGDVCNLPAGYSIPPVSRRGMWCWHRSPMNKFFDGDEYGDGGKAVLTRCESGMECCASLHLWSGEEWALGCHRCRSKAPGPVVPAMEFLAADSPPQPWIGESVELCAWRTHHRCQILLPGRPSPYGDHYKTHCPRTHCCYTFYQGEKAIAKGCAPCHLHGLCLVWDPTLPTANEDVFWFPPHFALPFDCNPSELCAGRSCRGWNGVDCALVWDSCATRGERRRG